MSDEMVVFGKGERHLSKEQQEKAKRKGFSDVVRRLKDETEINTEDFIKEHHGYVKDGRLHLAVICDGTYLFLWQMVGFLQSIECTDIKMQEGTIENPKKPWMCSVFYTSGTLNDKWKEALKGLEKKE